MDVALEETFGPIVPILRVSSDDEALQIANTSQYGLLRQSGHGISQGAFASRRQWTPAG